ncbi:MAG TPA: hypothetical protein VMB81_05830, partial [Candidatus Sulfotelmatobacter sp.]|nr:hypothetical protein [Candidatus Sulfotelmatobacter sp.]
QLLDGPIPWDALHVVTDSDRLFAVSLAPLGKDVAWQAEPWRADALDIAHWLLRFDSPANDYVAGARIRWHLGTMTEALWRAREIAGDLLVRRAVIEREALRVVHRMARDDTHGTGEAGRLLALSVLNGSLARALRSMPGRPGRAIFAFVPGDAELAVALTADGIAKGRIEPMLREHVAIAREAIDLDRIEPGQMLELEFLSGQRRCLRRTETAWAIDGTAVSRVERVSGDLALCYTRGLLGADVPAAEGGARE